MDYLTIEQVDKEVERLEKKYGRVLESKAVDPGAILKKFCAVVSIAVPILKFAKTLLFFKKKWQTIIQKIINLAGTACVE